MEQDKQNKNVYAVGDLVKNFIKELDEKKVVSEDELLEAWKEIVGEKASKKIKPISIYNKKLKVVSENPSWIHELNLEKRNILKKLQTKFGKDFIIDIKFQSNTIG